MVVWLVLPCSLSQDILGSLDHQSWNSRWLEVLAKENERGFHPVMLDCRDDGKHGKTPEL